MDLGLKNAAAVVAGASTGLGRAVAFGLANEGCNVAICSRSGDKINRTAKDIESKTGSRIIPVVADLNKKEDIYSFIDKAAEEFGDLNILYTNTGGPPSTAYEETTEEQWEEGINKVVMSAVRLSQAATPHLKKAEWGRIVHNASISTKLPLERMVISNITRAGLAGLSKSMSNELADSGILVNTVCPGFISTDRVSDLAGQRASEKKVTRQEILDLFVAGIPLGRMGTPEEYADLVVFLASKRNGYITGNVIQIDGGRFPGMQ
ncbi:MAG: SDR family oxidoreductase [bacterium]|nr:SDR family oxidoreductase [bacterium]